MDTSVTHQQETKTAAAILDTAPPAAPLVPRRAPEVEVDARRKGPADEAGPRIAYRHSETFGQFAFALSQAQGEFGELEKTLTATVTSRREGARSYTYEYEDLAAVFKAVRPALSKHGIAVMQFPSSGLKNMLVSTLLIHKSGEWFAGDLIVQLDGLDPQAVASATSYAKRIALKSMAGIAANEPDDDGRRATESVRKQQADVPAGFEAWWHDMEACADNGTAAFDEAWQKSNGAFKTHVVKHHREQLNAVKAKAAKVGKATK